MEKKIFIVILFFSNFLMAQESITGLPDIEFAKIHKLVFLKKEYDIKAISNWRNQFKKSPFLSALAVFYYCENNNIDSAKSVLSEFENSSNTFFVASKACINLFENRIEEAITDFNESIDIDTTSINVWSRFYLAIIYNETDPFKGHQMIIELNELYPDFSPVISELVRLKYENRQFKEAIELLLRLDKMDPNNADNYIFIAENYMELSDYEFADEYYDRIIKLSPSMYASYLGKAKILKNYRCDTLKSEQYYLKALELANDNPLVLSEVGVFYLEIEDFSKAEYYFKRVYGIKNTLYNIMNLILSLISQEKFNEAIDFIDNQNAFKNQYQMIFYKIVIYHMTDQKENLQKSVDDLISNSNESQISEAIIQLKKYNINIDYHLR